MPDSDEVPTADAVEQQQDPALPVPDEEAPSGQSDEVPLEVSSADWQEQQEEIIDDPEERSDD